LQLVETVALGRLRRDSGVLAERDSPFWGWDSRAPFRLRDCSCVVHARTHSTVCGRRKLRALCHQLFPFLIYATGHTATSAGGSFHWGGGKYTSKKEGDVGKTEISCLRRLRKRLRNPRVDSALDVAGCCCCSWCGQKLPRHKKFSFSISPTLLLLLLLILAL
jgi:hypothetical protein